MPKKTWHSNSWKSRSCRNGNIRRKYDRPVPSTDRIARKTSVMHGGGWRKLIRCERYKRKQHPFGIENQHRDVSFVRFCLQSACSTAIQCSRFIFIPRSFLFVGVFLVVPPRNLSKLGIFSGKNICRCCLIYSLRTHTTT